MEQKYQGTFLGGGLAVAAGGGLQSLAAWFFKYVHWLGVFDMKYVWVYDIYNAQNDLYKALYDAHA